MVKRVGKRAFEVPRHRCESIVKLLLIGRNRENVG
jgi:hypothetical protein